MRSLKVIIILMVIAVTGMAADCCNCPEPETHEYTLASLSVGNVDNSGEYAVDADIQLVKKESYGIKLLFSFKIAEQTSRASLNFSLMQSAYAACCFCDEAYYAMTDSIVSLHIFSETDFDASHPGDSDISEYFKIFKTNEKAGEFISIVNYSFSSISEYEILYGSVPVICFLMTPPSDSGEYRFRVEALLSDGRKFTETINAVLI